eukprot:CAMPEP_0198471226 /NCGR_PEP_ID=MMETSP1456-20131121/22861_2 /TAXON_ID=1461544 ORGANISM="Unidentified sp., Strain RCC1871" /NCGR_SAMPLE_ID=MMETSP1456 /ASSEMBLY_ACC=CAM_ASM_001119 /LENGTH=84 /DNA_ID=CAMNT_0044197785 /DNA_START=102 /DNA_END=352 /DNA_ORIENTATION=-
MLSSMSATEVDTLSESENPCKGKYTLSSASSSTVCVTPSTSLPNTRAIPAASFFVASGPWHATDHPCIAVDRATARWDRSVAQT